MVSQRQQLMDIESINDEFSDTSSEGNFTFNTSILPCTFKIIKSNFKTVYNIYFLPIGDATLPDLEQIVEMAKDVQNNNKQQPVVALPSSLEDIINVDDDVEITTQSVG